VKKEKEVGLALRRGELKMCGLSSLLSVRRFVRNCIASAPGEERDKNSE